MGALISSNLCAQEEAARERAARAAVEAEAQAAQAAEQAAIDRFNQSEGNKALIKAAACVLSAHSLSLSLSRTRARSLSRTRSRSRSLSLSLSLSLARALSLSLARALALTQTRLPALKLRVWGEIMGSHNYGNVGEYQSVLIMIDLIISPPTRSKCQPRV
eukprot:SAG25_NODE_6_length_29267_cov_21.188803_9_plen_161_part_00